MTRRRLLAPSVLLISAIAFAPRAATLTAAPWPSAAKAAAPEYGPPNGTLFIAGGSTEGLPITLIEKFIELGGGVRYHGRPRQWKRRRSGAHPDQPAAAARTSTHDCR